MGRRRLAQPAVAVGRLAELAVIALALIVAGGILVAPDLTIEQRAGGLGTIAAGLIVISRLSRRGER